MVKATKKRHNLIQDVVPSTTTSKPKRVMNCLIPDAVPSTWTSEPKTVDTCLTPDVEPSTSTAEPKTVKICLHQFQSKCSKKLKRPKVSIVLSPVISPPPSTPNSCLAWHLLPSQPITLLLQSPSFIPAFRRLIFPCHLTFLNFQVPTKKNKKTL